MEESSNKKIRGVGLVSIANPITLIASIEKFKQLEFKDNLFIILNVNRQLTDEDRVKTLIDNSFKVIKYYEPYFSKIYVIESTAELWHTHGRCLDQLFAVMSKYGIEEMAMFEEDAFLIRDGKMDEWFETLKENHLHCVVAPNNPNNYDKFFKKLEIFHNTINMPGKESVFFIRKDILEHYNWLGFDYFSWNPNFVYKPFEGVEISVPEEVQWDTFEFFSLNCWINRKIKKSIYHENNYDYWMWEGRGETDTFFRDFENVPEYLHYFNGALFTYLDMHGDQATLDHNTIMYNAPHYGNFMYHLSTYLIHHAMLLSVKKRYIEVLGVDAYRLHRNSHKRMIKKLLDYFGWFRIVKQFEMEKYFKFTCRFTNKVHYLTDIDPVGYLDKE